MLRTFMCGAALALYSVASHGATLVKFVSDPGDYIGAGKSQLIQGSEAGFTLRSNYNQGASIQINNAAFWSLDFSAPGKARLQPGKYSLATRFPFQSEQEAGLSISGDGRGCNQLSGSFEVLDVNYTANGQLDRFAATFEQHCEHGAPALRGVVAVNSNVQLPGLDPEIRINVGQQSQPGQQITVKAGQPLQLNVAIAANTGKGKVAQHWVGLLSPRGNQWHNGAGWASTSTPISAKIDYLNDQTLSYTVTPGTPGAYLFQYGIDNSVSSSPKADQLGYLVIIAK
ncbi:hypothetical protein [Chitinilyticum litopenaei]|uniref:hypothetical protein n=1 Tax=Chitinilyticum litopenaei TaxID=1121276 RepID=UPI0004186150|nr:hypothetical protein [Chitinilyticum litopenaei]